CVDLAKPFDQFLKDGRVLHKQHLDADLGPLAIAAETFDRRLDASRNRGLVLKFGPDAEDFVGDLVHACPPSSAPSVAPIPTKASSPASNSARASRWSWKRASTPSIMCRSGTPMTPVIAASMP